MATTATVPAPGFGSALWNAVRSFALLRESVVGMAGTALVLFWAIMALGAPLFAPCDPNATLQAFAKPGTPIPVAGACWTDTFILGADNIGRDVLSRIVWGARTVLTWAPIAAICAYVVGIVLGLAAGYYRGWIDDVLSGVANIILAFPGAGALHPDHRHHRRLAAQHRVRGDLRDGAAGDAHRARPGARSPQPEYVAAAETRGETAWRIMLVEILPNARGPLIVDGCLRLGYVIITIGVLGFLGLGLPPPDPDWGGMINETRQMALAFPHMTVYPCLAISSLILGFNLMADGLREISLRD